jgi:hypothetical protein
MDSWRGGQSTCRNCYFYHHQGHRGGECQRLRVPVQSHWAACPLGRLAFADSSTPSQLTAGEVLRPLQPVLPRQSDLISPALVDPCPQPEQELDSLAA